MTHFGNADAVPHVGDDPYAMWDAAYVMGSLSSNERREYESHLSGCPACRAAVNDLSGMPALLALLSREDVAGIDEPVAEPPVPPRILDSLLGTIGSRRRRSRLVTWGLTTAAVAAVLLAIAVLVAVRPAASDQERPQALDFTMTHVVPSTFDATFSLTEHDWGTQIEMNCTYFDSPAEQDDDDADTLAMVVVARDGTQTVLATWLAQSGQTARPSASTALTVDQIGAVRILEIGSSEVLLQHDL